MDQMDRRRFLGSAAGAAAVLGTTGTLPAAATSENVAATSASGSAAGAADD